MKRSGQQSALSSKNFFAADERRFARIKTHKPACCIYDSERRSPPGNRLAGAEAPSFSKSLFERLKPRASTLDKNGDVTAHASAFNRANFFAADERGFARIRTSNCSLCLQMEAPGFRRAIGRLTRKKKARARAPAPQRSALVLLIGLRFLFVAVLLRRRRIGWPRTHFASASRRPLRTRRLAFHPRRFRARP